VRTVLVLLAVRVALLFSALGKGAAFGLGQTRVPTDASFSVSELTTGPCPGYEDHIVPLVCGGPDAPSNMRWQTMREAAKDKWEGKVARGSDGAYRRRITEKSAVHLLRIGCSSPAH